MPLHMSHMAMAAAGFSAINLQAVEKLGIRLTEEERDSFMHIWRYVAYLIGVPEKILFRSEDEAIRLKEIGYLCEPKPGVESIAMAHGSIEIIPELIGVEEPAKKKKLMNTLFKASRALIGDELADALDYPKQSTFGVLALIRLQQRLQGIRAKLMPGASSNQADNFISLMQRSVYDDIGISYHLPDAVRDAESSNW